MASGSKRQVLVTGASGMLGKALMSLLAGAYEPVGVSRRAVPGGVSCDLSDPSQVKKLFESHTPSLVIHSAAYSDVDGCERDPAQAWASNALTSKLLSEACSSKRIPWIYVSTDYVFDGQKTSPYTEKDRAFPINIYGLTKWGGEVYALKSSVSSAIVRTSWLFGPDNPASFVNAILARLKNEKKVAVLDDQTDSPTHVKDLSEALIRIGEYLMAEHAKNPSGAVHETFQICNSGTATRYEMTLKMRDWLGLKNVSVEKADRSQIKNRLAVRPSYACMSAKRYEELFRTKLRPWQESLKEYVSGTV